MRLLKCVQLCSQHRCSALSLAENQKRTLEIAERLCVQSSVFELAQCKDSAGYIRPLHSTSKVDLNACEMLAGAKRSNRGAASRMKAIYEVERGSCAGSGDYWDCLSGSSGEHSSEPISISLGVSCPKKAGR